MGSGRHAGKNRQDAVVSVNPTSDLLLADARAALQRTLAHRPQGDLAIVFGYWALTRLTDAPEATEAALAAMQRSGAQQDFRIRPVDPLGRGQGCARGRT